MYYYLIITLSGLAITSLVTFCFLPKDWYSRTVRGGVTGLIVGSVLFIYGHIYIESPMNTYDITKREIMLAGATVFALSFLSMWGISRFFALNKQPKRRKQHIDRPDTGSWPAF